MQVLTSVDPDAIRELRQREEFFWLDLHEPASIEADVRAVGSALQWHPLLVEDLEHGAQRPKVEGFHDHSLVIVYGASTPPGEEIVFTEHALVVHGDYVVSVRRAPMPELDALRERLTTNDGTVTEGGVVHRIVDTVVDSTMSASSTMSQRIEELELRIDANAADDQLLTGLRELRREIVALRGMALAQRDALRALPSSLDAIPGFDVGLRDHFRDVTDHAIRVVDEAELSRALLDGAFEAYYAMLVAQQGAVSQRLTVIATIFLPLTFVTGFFGQNFGWMVEHVASRDAFLGWGVGATLVTALGLLLTFRRMRWF